MLQNIVHLSCEKVCEAPIKVVIYRISKEDSVTDYLAALRKRTDLYSFIIFRGVL